MDTAVRGEMINDVDSARRRYTTASLFNAVTQICLTRNIALQSFTVIVFTCNFEYFNVYHSFIIYKCFWFYFTIVRLGIFRQRFARKF